jgi:hypothetical protein
MPAVCDEAVRRLVVVHGAVMRKRRTDRQVGSSLSEEPLGTVGSNAINPMPRMREIADPAMWGIFLLIGIDVCRLVQDGDKFSFFHFGVSERRACKKCDFTTI